MLLKKIFIIALILSLTVSLAGCGVPETAVTDSDIETGVVSSPKETETDEDIFVRYPETVTLSIGLYNPATGWDMGDNELTKLIEDVLNVKIEAVWDLPWAEHNDRVTLAIATNSLPDAVVVFDYNLVRQMAENEMIADLTDTRKHFGPYIRSAYESDNNAALDDVTFDGKLYAIPSTRILGQHSLLWIRKDWLDELGLRTPESLEDVIRVAEAFVTQDPNNSGQDDTIGIPFNRWVWGADNAHASLDPFFATYGVFPRKFYHDSDGELYYGSTTPQMRTALSDISEHVNSGVISIIDDVGAQLITRGTAGMIFAPWWAAAAALRGSLLRDPTLEWIAVTAPLNDNGEFVVSNIAPTNQTGGYAVVRAGYEYPEAAAKVISLFYELEKNRDPFLLEKWTGDRDELPGFGSAPLNIQIDLVNVIWENMYLPIKEALETGNTEELKENQLKTYENVLIWKDDPTAVSIDDLVEITLTMIGAPETNNDALRYKDPAIFHFTPSMREKMDLLTEHENAVFYNIISGEAPISEFDNFINDWRNMGGDSLLEEIRDHLD